MPVARSAGCHRRRVIRGRRRQREHFAVTRIDHHHRAATAAERAHRRPLQVPRHREMEILGVVRVRPELAQRVRKRIAGQARQFGVIGELEADAAVARRRVADDMVDLVAAVPAVQLAVGVLLVVGEDVALAVDDVTARYGPCWRR